MHYVYILRSNQGKYYIGYQGKNSSTKKQTGWKIAYLEGYLEKLDAIGREKFLKSGSGYRYLKKQLSHYLNSLKNAES